LISAGDAGAGCAGRKVACLAPFLCYNHDRHLRSTPYVRAGKSSRVDVRAKAWRVEVMGVMADCGVSVPGRDINNDELICWQKTDDALSGGCGLQWLPSLLFGATIRQLGSYHLLTRAASFPMRITVGERSPPKFSVVSAVMTLRRTINPSQHSIGTPVAAASNMPTQPIDF
jgi:hypothetical protein